MTEGTDKTIKRLYRSRRDKVIGGVCGGLGGYMNVDPVVIRVVWLALILFGGTGLLAYLIAWILIPEAPEGADPGRAERKADSARVVGIILIVIGLIWIGGMFGVHYMHSVPWQWLAPLAIVVLGVALLLRPRVHEAAEHHAAGGTDLPAAPEAPPDMSGEPSPEDTGAETDTGDTPADEEDEKESGGGSPFDRGPLRRSLADRVIAGVCGGLARYFNLDPTLVRLLWALVTLASLGLGVFAYIALWLAVPEEE